MSASGNRRRLIRIGKAATIALVILACAVAAVPWLADSDAARRSIERKVSEALRGKVQYDTLVLHLLPRLSAEIRGAAFLVPGVIEGRAAAVHVRLALLPLFAGNVHPAAVRIEQLQAKLHIPPHGGGDAFEAYRAVIGPVVEALTRQARGVTASLVESRLNVTYGGRQVVAASELAAEVTVSGDAIELQASSAADIWKRAQARARIATHSLAASGTVQVTALRMTELTAGSAGGEALRARPGAVDATVSVETDGRKSARVTATATGAQLVLARGAREHSLGAVRLAAEIRRDANQITATFRDLQVGELVRSAAGMLSAELDGVAPPAFELKVPFVDLARLHAAATTLAGDHAGVPAWLALVSAGTLHDLSAKGAWQAHGEIMDAPAVQAEARLDAATLAVPAAGIVVRNGSGRFLLADGVLQGRELRGDLGRSAFSGGTLALELGGATRLRGLNAALNADLADALSVTRHLLKHGSPAVIAGIDTVEGRAAGTLDYDARRSASPLILEFIRIQAKGRHRSVPLPLVIRRADVRYSSGGMRVRGLAGSAGRSTVSDANIEIAFGAEPAIRTASGETVLALDELFPWLRSFDALRPALGDLELTRGTVGQQWLDWIRARGRLPAEAMPRAPIEIDSARLHWRTVQEKLLGAQASARVGGTVDVDLDATWSAGDLDLKRLVLKDENTNVHFALRLRPGLVDVSFDGTLDSRTLANMLARPPAEKGAIRGQFRAALDLREPRRSIATGAASGEGIDLSQRFGVPLAIERFRVEAKEKLLQVHETTLVAAGQRMQVNGSVEDRGETLALDARVTAQALDAERLLKAIARHPNAGTPPRPMDSRWDLPLSGSVTVAADSLAFGKYALQQVVGSVELAPRRITAAVTNARLCGIAVPFTLVLTPGGADARVQAQARGQSLERTLPCLTGEYLAISGKYDLDADLTASGALSALSDSARGTFHFATRGGRIYRSAVVTRAVAIDEVATRLHADPLKVKTEGLEYEEITAAGSLESGRMRLDHVVLDSSQLGMTVRGEVTLADGGLDLQGLVAPFDTVQRRLRRTPVVGRVLGAPLVVVPVQITGVAIDPQVRVLPAQAVGRTLLNLMATRFLFPIDLLDIPGARPAPKP